MNDPRISFSPKHHALLFAWISKEVHHRVGAERAQEIVKRAVRRYGEERGHRMSLRAKANGHRLDMVNYLAYGEWRADPGETQQEVRERTPHVHVHAHKCPWYEAWKAYDLLQYGKSYCQEVDEALVRGFNPELRIDVKGTLAEGEDYCDFMFYGANLTLPKALLLRYRQRFRPGSGAVMPWEYHLGHLYSTMGRVLQAELGEPGQDAIEAGMEAFGSHFGEGARKAIEAYQDTDFSQLPGSA